MSSIHRGGPERIAAARSRLTPAFSLLAEPDDGARWDARVADLARRQAEAQNVGSIDRDEVLAQAKDAIADFGARHNHETFYAFAFDATMLCLDSVEQFAAKMKDPELRRSYLGNRSTPPIDAGAINPGDFEYQGFVDIGDEFPALRVAYNDYFEGGSTTATRPLLCRIRAVADAEAGRRQRLRLPAQDDAVPCDLVEGKRLKLGHAVRKTVRLAVKTYSILGTMRRNFP